MVNKPKPLDLLNKSLKSSVIVRIRGGREFRGTLEGYDLHMNLILSDAEELNSDASVKSIVGEVLMRGDNVVYISPTVRRDTENEESEGKSKEAGEKEQW
ncbi:MAG: small nuclear ribonucleoprotein [Methanophagales archaeon]|nr:small nuclear ribonucleoprotein [Methanophagales archaeon]